MELLILLARRSWRTLMVACVTGFACGLAAAALIAVINDGLTNFAAIDASHALKFTALALVVVLTRIVADISLLDLGQTAVNDMRMHLSGKLLDTPYRRLQTLGKHRLLAILTDDAHTISIAVEQTPIVLVNAGIVLACLAYLGWLNLPMLVITVLLIVVGGITFQWPQNRALSYLSRARELKDQLFHQIRSLTDGAKELQLNQQRRHQFFERLLHPTSVNYKREFIRGMSIYAVALNWGNGFFYLLIGVALYVGPQFIELQAALVTGYILTLLYMITPLSELMNALPMLGRATVALNSIKALEGELEIKNCEEHKVHSTAVSTLMCKTVSHTYLREQEDGRFTLGPFDLLLHGGEITFITGGNGSGKTTLALLLTGLYAPEGGEILLNNEISSTADNHYFRQHFAAIFTDFCLFEHLLGSDNPALMQKAQEYLVHLQLDHKVSINNGQLSTVDLSSGQRKRLALLAAYLEDRPCYLFDEWAADQDPVFKRFFYTKILPDLKRRNKLVIVITHDDAYFHLADKLIKVDQGQVIETTLKTDSAIERMSQAVVAM